MNPHGFVTRDAGMDNEVGRFDHDGGFEGAGSSAAGAAAAPTHPTSRRMVKLSDPQSRFAFLREHPFFAGTSQMLRDRLAPQLVRRCSRQLSSEVLRQGEGPAGATDYLFLTAPHVRIKVEVTFDGRTIAVCGSNGVFGHEVAFGVTSRFLFGARVVDGSSGALWVIPRGVIQSLLSKSAYKDDAETLRKHTHAITSMLLHDGYVQVTSYVFPRLAEQPQARFNKALVEAMTMQIYAAGSVMRREEGAEDSCFCVFRGRADVSVGGAHVTSLSSAPASSWWGLLEILGVSRSSPARVTADTDCIIWRLSMERKQELLRQFPKEARQFDKIALEHVKLLQPSAAQLSATPVFSRLDHALLQELAGAAELRICAAGHSVVREGDPGGDFYFIARGSATIRRTPRRSSGEGAKRYALVHDGAWFGELAALGFQDRQPATVVCETICDLRVLPGAALVRALSSSSAPLVPNVLELTDANGSDFEAPSEEELQLLECLQGLSAECRAQLGAEMRRHVALQGQVVAEQGQRCETMYVLLRGTVALEFNSKCVGELHGPFLLGDMSVAHRSRKSIMTVRSRGACFFWAVDAARAAGVLQRLPADQRRFQELAASNFEKLQGLLHKDCEGSFGFPARGPESASSLGSPHVVENAMSEPGSPGAGEVVVKKARRNTMWSQTLFKDSDPLFLELITNGLQKRVYFANQVMLLEGDEGDFAILIYDGSGIVEIAGIRVGEVQPGCLIGEIVLLGDAPRRTATVTAVSMVSAYIVPQSLILDAFRDFPQEKERVKNIMRLREQANEVLMRRGSEDTAVQRSPGAAARGALRGRSTLHSIAHHGAVLGGLHRPLSTDSDHQHHEHRSASHPAPERPETEADYLNGICHPNPGRNGVCQPRNSGLHLVTPRAGAEDDGSGSWPRSRSPVLSLTAEAPSVKAPPAELKVICIAVPSETAKQVDEAAPARGVESPPWSPAEDATPASPKTAMLPPLDVKRMGSRGRSAGRCGPDKHWRGCLGVALSGNAAECTEWAQRRHDAIKDAPLQRSRRLVHTGELLPLVPQNMGYQVATPPKPCRRTPRFRAGGAFFGGAVAPSHQLLCEAETAYASPVA